MWTPLGITPPAFSILLVQTWLLISVSTLALEAGGSSLNPIQASENIVILETNVCTSSVPTWHRKNRCMIFYFWHDDAWRELRASLFEEWNFMLDTRLGYASICKRVAGHTHWDFFFWRRGISFRFGPFVFLLTEAIFSFNFGKAASIVSLGEAKNGFIFGTKLCLRVWSQNLSFLEFVVDNSRLACVGSGRMRAEWVVAALLWFYKHDSGS